MNGFRYVRRDVLHNVAARRFDAAASSTEGSPARSAGSILDIGNRRVYPGTYGKKGNAMKSSRLVGFASFLLVACLASPAFAMYHPSLGRWVSRDPIQYRDGTNLYDYAHGSPLDCRDPSGKLQEDSADEAEYWEEVAGEMGISPDEDHWVNDQLRRAREQSDWLRIEQQHTDAYSMDKAELSVVPTRSFGGTIEVDLGEDKAEVFIAPEEPLGPGGIAVYARDWGNRLRYGVGAESLRQEHHNQLVWYGTLDVAISSKKTRRFQVCPAYWWNVSIRNSNCQSCKLKVSASCTTGSHAQCMVPESRTHDVRPEDGWKNLGKAMLGVVGTFSVNGTFNSLATATISVSCAE